MSSKSRSSSSKVCCFCNLAEDNELEYGKIYEYNGIVTHYYCLLLSSNMEQKGNDDEGILGFLSEDIQKELRRGKRLVCSYCKKQGATLGCCNVRCKRIFHFPCGVKNGSLHQFFGEFRSYCVNHRPKQKIDDQVFKQAVSVDIICYICYDKVNTNDVVKTLWAPCCKKDAWFHRNCVQQLALSAGYFFKCPLCNNKKDFQKAMLEYGIFVPSQDASWELVPNAFEELLYRHDQCDAPKCLCPKGRKHTSNNAKWELALCRTCGSQGIHMFCGQLKWANPVWECNECTSILNNKHVNLGNSSAIGSSSQNRDSDSDLNSGSASDTDSDSDTDISVGTDFPCALVNSTSTDLSSLESILDIRLRPGPRSFKLQQQMIKLGKWLNLTNTDLEKGEIIEASPKDTNELLSKNDEEKEPSTSKEIKENIPQQESKDSQKEKQSPSKNDEKSQPIQKAMDVIVIESDDDEVELIALKQTTNLSSTQQPTQSGSSHIPCTLTSKENTLLHTTENFVASKSQCVMTIDLSENDHTNNLSNPTASVTKASKENESPRTISKNKVDATSQVSILDLTSNDVVETIVEDTSKTSIMNIKITNVTSLPPEVFDNVSNVACNDITLHTNITDTSSHKPLEQLSSTKRSMREANDNCKKIKTNDSSHKTNSVSVIVPNTNKTNNIQNDTKNNTNNTNNTNRQQSERTSANESSKIDKNDKNPSKCTTNTSNSSLNNVNLTLNTQTNNSSSQYNYVQIQKAIERGVQQVRQNLPSLEENSVNLLQSNENHVAQRNTTEFMTFAKNNQVLLPFNGYYLQQISNPSFTVNQNIRNETNVYAIPSNSVILPNVTENITMLNNSTVLVNQPIMTTNVTAPNFLNDKQIVVVNQKETASKKHVPVSTPSVENNPTNMSYCDGDAGTRPAETGTSYSKKNNDPPSECQRSVSPSEEQTIAPQDPVATYNVFPQITNNHNTCHQPRLIPRYVNLQDLKFRICASNNIQMTLYDTFSVNISMKNPRDSKKLIVASRESKESAFVSREASYSSDYIDDISTEKPCSDKLYHFSNNENCPINDKSTCSKYVTRGQDDAKENLDPTRCRISHSDTLNNVNPTSNVDDAISNYFCGENDGETRLVSGDTNVSVLNRTICNTNVDNVMDGVTLISNNCNQGSRINVEVVQQHKQASVRNAISMLAEERPGARLFFKDNNRIVHSVNFDLNVMNKNIKKISQNNITIHTNQRTDDDRIDNDHTDDSLTLRNGFKHLDSMNVTKSKINNRNITRVSNITKFNEHSILNKQIDACNSKKFTQCKAFQENIVCNGETKTKSNEFSFKVSIDLCKIQNLIDSKPELFENRKHDANEYTRTNRLSGLDKYGRQQVRYCDIENRDNICPPKNRELQKSNYVCDIERMQPDVFSGTNTFLKYQKSHQRVKYFNKDMLDR